jgi:hypothetical protein
MNYGLVLIRDISNGIDELRDAEPEAYIESVELHEGMQRCKHLARAIKAQQTPSWPCFPTPDMPSRVVADELVDCYLRTSERVYRVLHLPSFRRDYEALWMTPTEQDPGFRVQLKLVLAIGAATYSQYFHLRPSAIRWVYEAESWLANPALKHRIGLQYIQTHILLLIAREGASVGEDFIWVSAGALYRSALYMGLHRDPSNLPPRTIFANEMHRRLWSTILEICLQMSLATGASPMISLEDFDTLPPSNMDDEQLTEPNATPKLANEFTQVSVSIALRATFPARLAVCKFLNDFKSSGTYDETLRLDAEYRTSYKTLRRTFQSFSAAAGSPSDFDIRITEMIVQRYLLALHMPFFASGLRNTVHSHSQKSAVDASLKIWYAACLSSDDGAVSTGPATSIEKTDIARITATGSSFHGLSIMFAILVVGVGM